MTYVPDRVQYPLSSIDTSRSRFAQLVYTSFDDSDGSGGGWRVKVETGDLDDQERRELTARIVIRFDVGESLPAYPNDEMIANRPARLMYGSISRDRAGYWHTVDAGKDATGRPGNVLAHVVLDRRIGDPIPLRPIELWGSPQWLRAYGPSEVTAAVLATADHPQPTGAISAASVVRFLTGLSVDQQIVFRVLLDAVHAAMSGGRKVILATRDVATGPWWIAAISYLMSPGTARRLSWSTYDDPELAASDARSGVHLIVVASDRAHEIPRGDWLLIDDLDQPSLGTLGAAHGTRGGNVAVTGWSILAEAALFGESLANALIAGLEAVARDVGDRDLSPTWPLAMAVRKERALAEFHPEADRIIADEAPEHYEQVAAIAELVDGAVSATAPTDVGGALERLDAAQRKGVGVPGAARRFLTLALAERDWMYSSGPIETVPAVHLVDFDPFVTVVDGLLDDVDDELYVDHAVAMRKVLRIADLVDRLVVPGSEAYVYWTAGVAALIARYASALASGESVHALILDPAIRPETRERLVRPAVARLGNDELDRLRPEVWEWLFGGDGRTPEIPANPFAYDVALLPRYIAGVLDNPDDRRLSPHQRESLASAALALALGADEDELGNQACRRLVRQFSGAARLPVSEIAENVRRWPARFPPGEALHAVLYESAPQELVEAVASAAIDDDATAEDSSAVAAARIRLLGLERRPWSADRTGEGLGAAELVVSAGLQVHHISAMHDDLVVPFGALVACAQVLDEPWADLDDGLICALNSRLERRVEHVAELMADAVETEVIDTSALAGMALLTQLGFVRTVAPFILTSRTDDRSGIINRAIRLLVERRTYRGPIDAIGLRDAAWPQVKKMPATAAESFFENYVRASKEWLHDNRIADSGARSMFRRSNRED